MNLQLFGNGGTREQELRNAMLQSLTETTNQLASTLYTHTWKTRTTPDGNQIISLRASQAKREGQSPWPTPVAEPANGTPEAFLERKRRSVAKTGRSMGIVLTDLAMVSQLAAWPTPMSVPDSEKSHGQQSGQYRKQMDDLIGWTTPSSRDWKDSEGMATTGTNPDGSERERLDQLPRQANLASWPTPQAFDASNDGEGRALRYKGNAPSEAGNTRNPETPGSYRGDLKDYAALASWPTPQATEAGKVNQSKSGGPPSSLKHKALLASWPTPNAMEGGQTSRGGERKDEMLMSGMVQPSPEGPARLTASGVMLTGFAAGMGGGGQLNQALPRWLQAIPAEWGQAALEAHQKLKANKARVSTRTKQRRSQKA